MSELKAFVDCIQACESTTKKDPKIEAISKLDKIGQTLVYEAQNPFRVFGVKKYNKPKNYALQDAPAANFFSLLECLQNRQLTGNNARAAVENTLALYTENTAKYLARVLDKDLKAGFSESTVNKVFPNLVPVFDIMLAQKVDEKFVWFYPVQAEYKMDGTRLIAYVENGVVTYFSRSGKPSDFCNGLFDEELLDMAKYVGESIVVDGECLGENFTETLNAKSSDNDDAKAKLKFFAFDYMTRAEWIAQQTNDVQSVRTEKLANIIKIRDYKKIIKSRTQICYNYEEVRAFFNLALDEKFEGLILKRLDAHYEWGRSKSWYKWKPVYEYDLTITGVYEGREGSKNEGRMGGFNCEGTDENGNFIQTNVGSLQVGKKGGWLDSFIAQLARQEGIDLNQVSNDEFFRTYVWNHPNEFIGRTAQLEAQELSKSADSDSYSLRFPVLVLFREDK